MVTTVFCVRAVMVSGAQHDLLLFNNRAEAFQYKRYLERCHLLGYQRFYVVRRHILGVPSVELHQRTA